MTSYGHQFTISYWCWWSCPLQKKKKKKSHDDEYDLFKNVELDDTLIKKIEEGYSLIGNFIVWPTKCLRYAYVGL